MTCLNRRTLLAGLGTCLLTGPLLAQGRLATPSGFTGQVIINEGSGVRLHTYLADLQGSLVTSHVIEGPSALIVVDAQFTPTSARELRTYVDSIGKPVERLILSHQHPDHWFGVHHFGPMPVHAGPVTASFISEAAAQLVDELGADSSAPEVGGTIPEGSQEIAGVTLNFRHVLDTEAPEMLVIEVPAVGAVIVQDLVYNRVHAVVSRQIDSWVTALQDLETQAGQSPLILAGHGEPASPADLGSMIDYLTAVKPLLESNIGNPEEAETITDEIAAAFPDYRMPQLLTFGLSRALAQ